MSVSSFFSNSAETRELHQLKSLRSRYYKSNYKKTKQCIKDYVGTLDAELRNIDDDHKEIFVQGKKFHIIFSILQVSPIETSIDITVVQYGLIGMNRPQKQIIKVYAFLDKHLEFKGVSLHP